MARAVERHNTEHSSALANAELLLARFQAHKVADAVFSGLVERMPTQSVINEHPSDNAEANRFSSATGSILIRDGRHENSRSRLDQWARAARELRHRCDEQKGRALKAKSHLRVALEL